MAYGLAEGFRKTAIRLGGKKKNRAVMVATFGNHFTLNDALERVRKEGLLFETEKGHSVKIVLDKNREERAERGRKSMREGFGYVEALETFSHGIGTRRISALIQR